MVADFAPKLKEKKTKIPEYKVPPHFQWSEQRVQPIAVQLAQNVTTKLIEQKKSKTKSGCVQKIRYASEDM